MVQETFPNRVWERGKMKKILPREAVAGRNFDPHYRAETAEQIPPSSEGVAFKAAAGASCFVFIGRKT
jgi:hypothetical protein